MAVFIWGDPWWDRSAGPAADDADRRRAVLAAYQKHGLRLFEYAGGAFAIALVDSSRDRVVLGIDRMGIGSLSFATGRDGSLIFGNSAEDVARHPAVQAAVDPQGLFDYFYFHMVPSPGSVWRGVQKLQPAHQLIFSGGRIQISRYWKPRFAGSLDAPLPALKDDLKTAMRNAVARSAAGGREVGAFLSGGLDSSAVVGMLAEVDRSRGPRTFSVGFAAEDYNELGYARIAARRFGADATELEVTPDDVADAIPLIAGAYAEPFGNSSAVPTYFCARRARELGITRLLAGDGGDELFGGNRHYPRQAVFEWYYRVPSALRKHVLEGQLLKWIPESAPFPLGKVRSYIDQARIPLPHRLHSWDFMYRTPATSVFAGDFLAGINLSHPAEIQEPVYAEPDSPEFLDRMLYFDWQFILADNDLRKVNGTCELAGIEVRYPMLDIDVVDYSLRLPGPLKVSGQTLRPFFKDACRGFLPDETLAKEKHGFGLPFGLWLKSPGRLRDLVLGTLGDLKRRQIVRPEFLDEVMSQHQDGHASFYGYIIWDLVMLEQWLKAHADSR